MLMSPDASSGREITESEWQKLQHFNDEHSAGFSCSYAANPQVTLHQWFSAHLNASGVLSHSSCTAWFLLHSEQ
jgi:hypothetical protein